MTKSEFNRDFASRDREFNARADAASINDLVFRDVEHLATYSREAEQAVKSAYDHYAA